jgi:hypothetical protein
MCRLARIAVVLAALLCLPSLLYAQASIVGVVKDTSGAVLPGVTVEASSPSLIEKTRTGISDGGGQYRIVDLVPGAYTVTYTLAGFNTVRREGIELSGSFTATVNVDLRVGALEETITVTGETPTVDVQSTTRQRVLDRSVIDTIPAGRTTVNLGVLIPGVSLGGGAQDVGGGNPSTTPSLVAHGGTSGDQHQVQNGIPIDSISQTGFVTPVEYNPAGAQEVTIDTAALSTELASGGVRINVVTRDGGNAFKGTLFANFANHSMQGSNFTDALKAAGLGTPNSIKKVMEINPGFGGPIAKDRLWFFLAARYVRQDRYAAGIYSNLNANQPDQWTYLPDLNSRPENDKYIKDGQLRLTWQATPRNKFGLVWHDVVMCQCPDAVSSTAAPEAGVEHSYPLMRQVQADWTSPITSRLLLEGGAFWFMATGNTFPEPGLVAPEMIAVTEQSTGLLYRTADPGYRQRPNSGLHSRAAVSYITGAHAYKAGMTYTRGWSHSHIFANQPVTYRFNNGVPNQITELAYPYDFQNNVDHDLGLFLQDKWTVHHLTLSYGGRFDYLATSFEEQTLGSTPLTPGRHIVFPAKPNLNWRDVTPHLGASYDLFGNGKTAVKASLNKYLQSMSTDQIAGAPNPVNALVLSTTRSWADANRNFNPECDLTNPAANGECGAMANAAFGGTQPGTTFDPDILKGWGKRGYNWEFSGGVQHEILPRVAVEFSYFRRSYGNLLVTDDLAVGPSDYSPFSITAPVDPRLPGGGGNVIAGLYNLNPNKVGSSTNYITAADNFGKPIYHWNGIDLSVNARPGRGVLLQGGVSTGKTLMDDCAVVQKLPEMQFGFQNQALINPLTPVGGGGIVTGADPAGVIEPAGFCHQETNYRAQAKFLGSYTVPRVDVLVSATWQSLPGPPINAYYVATNAQVAPSLGRSLSGNAANVTVNLVAPGSLSGDRLNQVDLRIGKIVRVNRVRTTVSVDVYNALNANPVLTVNNNYAVWQRPTSILLARFAKVGVQLDF